MTYALSYPGAPHCCEHHRGRPASFPATLVGRFRAFAAKVSLAVEKANQRAELAELSDHLLSDIGQTRQQALKEANRGFWL